MLLGFLLILFGITMMNTLLILSRFSQGYPFFQDISKAVILLIGPLIYILVRNNLSKSGLDAKIEYDKLSVKRAINITDLQKVMLLGMLGE